MADENFSSHTIGEEEPKKRRVVRRKPSEDVWTKKVEKDKKKKIDKELTAIYEDNSGKIPDMKAIRVRRHRPVLRAVFALLVVGGLLAAAAWAGFFLLPNATTTDEQISLTINGPAELTLGSTTTYIIAYSNDQNKKLLDAVLTINYPESFAFSETSVPASNAGHTEWNLGEIPANGSGEIKITGKNFGAIDQKNSWRIFLNYRPENFNSEMQKNTTLETVIAKSPFAISAAGPDSTAVGGTVNYVFTVKNEGDWWPENLIVDPSWPENFYLVSSSPEIAKDGKWTLVFPQNTSTTPATNTVFTLTGKFTDLNLNLDNETVMDVGAGLNLPYGPNAKLFQIASSSLKTALVKNGHTFSVAINGTMTDLASKPGDMLNITLYLKNTSKDTMKDAQVKLMLDSPALKRQSTLNWPQIEDKLNGDILGEQMSETVRRGQITWGSLQLAALKTVKPNDEITIDLRLPVKDASIFDLEDLSEFLIKTNAEVRYTDSAGKKRLLSSNPINITLNSDLTFEQRVSKQTENGLSIREAQWILNNNFHPLKNIELSATLFGEVAFESEQAPAGSVVYDQNEQKITWTIPEMPDGIDVLALPFTITINETNPTQNVLISKVRIKAEDVTTRQTIEFMADETPVE